MDNKFKDIEAVFNRMRRKFRDGEISKKEYIDSLKQLRIKDDDGRFWMIGAQSGQWYYFDGGDWILSSPPSLMEKRAICIYCGFENDLEAAVCGSCGGRVAPETRAACPDCGMEIDDDSGICSYCVKKDQATLETQTNDLESPAAVSDGKLNYVVRSVQALSFFWFSGGVGILAGALIGLFIGATAFFPGLADVLPPFFKDMQGKLVGGVVFTGIGAVLGFLALSVAGLLFALAANAILSFSGGLKIKLDKTALEKKEKRP